MLRRRIALVISFSLAVSLPILSSALGDGSCPSSCLCSPAAKEAQPVPKQHPMSAEVKEALSRLQEGNARFVAGKPKHKHTSLEWRAQIAQEQHPFATILGCSDSRVPPELIFDQGFGDLFVVRVAGNVIDSDIAGSLEYAGLHLKTRLFVILGHEKCGAVTAALHAHAEQKHDPPGLQRLLRRIKPALKDIDPKLGKERQLAAAVESNVRWSIKQLRELPEHRQAFAEGKVVLLGAVYELQSGKVRFLE